MKTFLPLVLAALLASTTYADSNGTIGSLLNSTGPLALTGGPFDHGGAAGSPDNSSATLNVSDTFDATQITIAGDVVGVLAFDGEFWLNEADFVLTTPGLDSFTLGTSAGRVPDTTIDPIAFSTTGIFPTATAVNGTWSFEFIDTFDDGAGADSISDNVFVTLEEFEPNQDSSGSWSLGSMSEGDTVESNGEFLVEDIFDSYTFTLEEDTSLFIETDEDPLGISGDDPVDTEIGLFDAAGTLIAYSDDEGNGLYSFIDGFAATAGDYTLVVSGFGSNIASTQVGILNLADVTGGTSIGDYTLSITAVPEPTSLGLLAVVGMIGFTRRRR